METEKQLEFRVCWSASTDIGFRGESDWQEANEGETAEEIEDDLNSGRWTDALDIALSASGFEWWVETREKPHGD